MLGCGRWQVAIGGRTGSPVLHSDLPIVSGEMHRVLDETSEARVTLGDCCSVLSDVRSVRHSLLLFRDGVAVWGGPIVRVNYRTGQIIARDVTWWLERRLHRRRREFVGVDVVTIAERLILDALAPDDPGILNYLDVTPSGIVVDRTYDVDTIRSVMESIRELARDGLDFTALGWRIVLGGDQITTRPVGVLTDESFVELPDIVDDGLALATSVTVEGAGVRATVGGIDPYFGLVERGWSESDIPDVVSAQAAAQTRLDLLGQTPLVLGDEFGDDIQSVLAPSAPVEFSELVPGALIRVAITEACRDIVSDLRLHDVTARFDSGGESVSITLQSPGTGI